MFAKCDVNGVDTCEVYQYLRMNSELFDAEKGTAKEIPWNFAKFLVDSEGHVKSYYGPKTSPEEIRPDINNLLGL